MDLANVAGLKRLGRLREDVGYVYFLVKDDQVIYVGQTRTPVHSRVWHHQTYTGGSYRSVPGTRKKEFVCVQKDFDDAFYIEVDVHDLKAVENYFIDTFKPLLNRTKNVILPGHMSMVIEKYQLEEDR